VLYGAKLRNIFQFTMFYKKNFVSLPKIFTTASKTLPGMLEKDLLRNKKKITI